MEGKKWNWHIIGSISSPFDPLKVQIKFPIEWPFTLVRDTSRLNMISFPSHI